MSGLLDAPKPRFKSGEVVGRVTNRISDDEADSPKVRLMCKAKVEDLQAALMSAINQVADGTMEPAQANAISGLAKQLCGAFRLTGAR